MEEVAPVRASVVDLVNVALEEPVRAGLELSAFSTLDRMAASVRTRVEAGSALGLPSGSGPPGSGRLGGWWHRMVSAAVRSTWSRSRVAGAASQGVHDKELAAKRARRAPPHPHSPPTARCWTLHPPAGPLFGGCSESPKGPTLKIVSAVSSSRMNSRNG